ncbi:MAG: arabinogalactan endo-1,4-beta-galactosidase, partial [Chitinophagaceae bacterium]
MKKLFALLCSAMFLLSCKKEEAGPEEPLPDPEPQPVAAGTFVKGADISWVTEMEAAGKKFYNRSGTAQDLFGLLKSMGLNTVRLRVWVNPANGWNNKADVVAKAQRAKAAGLRTLINFHYSDSWADPGKQPKPAAWAAFTVAELATAMAAHTTDV